MTTTSTSDAIALEDAPATPLDALGIDLSTLYRKLKRWEEADG